MFSHSPFEIIYEAAQAWDLEKIQRALVDVDIDIYNGSESQTPISKLLAHGHTLAAEFLTLNFKPRPEWIAAGLAQLSDKTELYAFLTKLEAENPGRFFQTLVHAAGGLAQSEDVNAVSDFLDWVEERFADYLIPVLRNAIRHSEFAGHETAAKKFFARAIAISPEQKNQFLTCRLEGLAQQKAHRNKAYAILDSFKAKGYVDEVEAVMDGMIYGFALGGHDAEVYQLLEIAKKKYPKWFCNPQVLARIARSFVDGGHATKAYAFFDKINADFPPKKINKGFSTYLPTFSPEARKVLEEMTFAFALNGQKGQVRQLMAQQAAEIHLLRLVICGFCSGGYEHEALEYFAMFRLRFPDTPVANLVQWMASHFSYSGHRADKFLEMVKEDFPDQLGSVLNNLAMDLAKSLFANQVEGFFEMLEQKFSEKASAVIPHIALGFAAAGYKRRAYAYLTWLEDKDNKYHGQLAEVLASVADGFAQSDSDDAFIYFDRIKLSYPDSVPAVLEKMAFSFAAKESKSNSAYKLLDMVVIHYPEHIASVIKEIARAEKENAKCIDQDWVLMALAHMDNSSQRSELALALNNLRPDGPATIDPVKLLRKAEKLQRLMKIERIGYPEALAWIQPELLTWVLQFSPEFKAGQPQDVVPIDIALLTASFLVPAVNSDTRWEQFKNKFSFHIDYNKCRTLFFQSTFERGDSLAMRPKNEAEESKLEPSTINCP